LGLFQPCDRFSLLVKGQRILHQMKRLCFSWLFLTFNPHATGTTQACLFRDNYSHISGSGLSVYGLSTDSPKSNTTFVTKQSLPYPLLCDPSGTLISAIGMKKAPKGTSRGVVVMDKTGKVTALEQGGPQRTVDVVMEVLLKGGAASSAAADPAPQPTAGNDISSEDAAKGSINGQTGATSDTEAAKAKQTADTAAEVADSAEKIDQHVQLGPEV
jgi:thioredoxin-dependent peroxiredoxin